MDQVWTRTRSEQARALLPLGYSGYMRCIHTAEITEWTSRTRRDSWVPDRVRFVGEAVRNAANQREVMRTFLSPSPQ